MSIGAHPDLVVVRLEAVKKALAQARTPRDTQQILDVAATAEIYARRQQLGADACRYATEIKRR